MSEPARPPGPLDRAVAGDEAAFSALVEPHRRPLFRHCYRMLGSGHDAEDATQETLLRAWQRLGSYGGTGPFGGWLHRIATNVCLDTLRSRRRRLDPVEAGPPSTLGGMSLVPEPGVLWVEPVSDSDLALSPDPQDEVVRREEISLAFVAALQRLAPRQRAALLLHDVLGFSHAEVSEVLGVSRSAVNSLLSRARDTVKERPYVMPVSPADAKVARLLERYLQAWQLADIDAFVRLVTDDIRFSMPPLSAWFDGRDAVAAFVEYAVFAPARPGGIQLHPGWCNGQPAFAIYAPGDAGALVASGLQVLELVPVRNDYAVSAIVSFRDPDLPVRCGLPPVLPVRAERGL